MTSTIGLLILPSPAATLGLLAASTLLSIPAAFNEANGINLTYSKFAHGAKGAKYASRKGMAIAYAGGLVTSVAGSAWLLLKRGGGASVGSVLGGGLPVVGPLLKAGAWLVRRATRAGRPMLVSSMLLGHFAKRELEVGFLHKYSGSMEVSSAWAICISYTLTALTNIGFVASVPDSVYGTAAGSTRVAGLSLPVVIGVALYAVGQAGNFYHHWLLARLRSGTPAAAAGADTTKQYKAPKGGLFKFVVCPHYLFELVAWAGMAAAGQHLQGWLTVVGMTGYLMGRSRSTHKWYQEKGIEGFPGNRKSLIPSIY